MAIYSLTTIIPQNEIDCYGKLSLSAKKINDGVLYKVEPQSMTFEIMRFDSEETWNEQSNDLYDDILEMLEWMLETGQGLPFVTKQLNFYRNGNIIFIGKWIDLNTLEIDTVSKTMKIKVFDKLRFLSEYPEDEYLANRDYSFTEFLNGIEGFDHPYNATPSLPGYNDYNPQIINLMTTFPGINENVEVITPYLYSKSIAKKKSYWWNNIYRGFLSVYDDLSVIAGTSYPSIPHIFFVMWASGGDGNIQKRLAVTVFEIFNGYCVDNIYDEFFEFSANEISVEEKKAEIEAEISNLIQIHTYDSYVTSEDWFKLDEIEENINFIGYSYSISDFNMTYKKTKIQISGNIVPVKIYFKDDASFKNAIFDIMLMNNLVLCIDPNNQTNPQDILIKNYAAAGNSINIDGKVIKFSSRIELKRNIPSLSTLAGDTKLLEKELKKYYNTKLQNKIVYEMEIITENINNINVLDRLEYNNTEYLVREVKLNLGKEIYEIKCEEI